MSYLLEVGQPNGNIVFQVGEPSIKEAALTCTKLSDSEISSITFVRALNEGSNAIELEVADLIEFKEKVLRSKRIVESIKNDTITVYKFIGLGKNIKNSMMVEALEDQIGSVKRIIKTMFTLLKDVDIITVYKNEVVTATVYRDEFE